MRELWSIHISYLKNLYQEVKKVHQFQIEQKLTMEKTAATQTGEKATQTEDAAILASETGMSSRSSSSVNCRRAHYQRRHQWMRD